MKNFPSVRDSLFIWMAKEELEAIADAKRRKRLRVIVIAVICEAMGMFLFCVIGWFAVRIRRAKRGATTESLSNPFRDVEEEPPEEDLELPLFGLETISTATDKFSFKNKIGEGGFGIVYKTWKLWNEDRPLELVDALMEESDSADEVNKMYASRSFVCAAASGRQTNHVIRVIYVGK